MPARTGDPGGGAVPGEILDVIGYVVGRMTYHWQWVSADQVVLLPKGTVWSGRNSALVVAASINKSGPHSGSGSTVFTASGPLMDAPQRFGSFEAAMKRLEVIVAANGDGIEGGR